MHTIFNFDTIVYHNPCNDGTTALWCANYYKNIPEKVPCKAGTIPTINVENKNILFVDICPNFDYLIEISKTAKNVIILDHHKTSMDTYEINKDKCPTNLQIILDMEKSGCQITWDYFFQDIIRPWFVDYVADRDLWKWKLPNSKEINQILYDNNMIDPYYLENITNLINYSQEQIDEIVKEGSILLKFQKKQLDIAISRSLEANITINEITYNIWLGTTTSADRSDLGNLLANKELSSGLLPDFSATWIYEPKLNEWWISLRGHKSSPDLSIIARVLGGGGHKAASAFSIKSPKTLTDIFIIK
jgi:oligoribonuclease NrnB/cAMP/cGMP phosphodiesterase (DHH superfamily)